MRIRILAVGLLVTCLQFTEAMAADLTHTLKRINDSGEINLGFRNNEPPMSFLNDSGKAVGYSIDLCESIVAAVKQKLDRTDIKVNYVAVNAAERFDAIQSSKIDLLCGSTTKTLTRSEKVGFTQLTFVTGATIVSRNDAALSNLTALKGGKKVAVVDNTTTIATLRRAIKKLLIDAEVVPVASADEGMELLDKGEVDAFSSDQVILIGQIITRSGGNKYFLSPQMYSFEPFALALQRGDADFQLVADSALSQLNKSGKIGQIYGEWFGRFGEKPPMILQALYQLNAIPE